MFMMKKMFIILFITIFTLLFLFYFLLKRQFTLRHFTEKGMVILLEHIEDSFQLNKLNISLPHQFMSTDYEIFSAKRICGDGSRHLLLVSRAGCFSCMEKQISIVESYNRQHSLKIGVLFSNETIRGLQQYKRTKKIESGLFITQYSEMLEKVVEQGPLLIELKEDGSILRVFRPIPEFPELTAKFLELGNMK